MVRITRGDHLAGGNIRKGKVSMWERWEAREVKEDVIEICPDEYLPQELHRKNKLVHLLPTPTYLNMS